jgi:hypothetical protein
MTCTRVDELVDNWWTTCLSLGVTRPILWMIRAIPQILEIGPRSLLRRRSGSAKNLPRHQRRWPGPEGNQGVSEHQVPGVCESGARSPGVSGRVYLTGGPSREGAFLGGGHRVDRGAPRLCRPMVARSADPRAEASDRWRCGTERPLPSHTWKGPLPCGRVFQAFCDHLGRHADTNLPI